MGLSYCKNGNVKGEVLFVCGGRTGGVNNSDLPVGGV
jgi:hypothetical protein